MYAVFLFLFFCFMDYFHYHKVSTALQFLFSVSYVEEKPIIFSITKHIGMNSPVLHMLYKLKA